MLGWDYVSGANVRYTQIGATCVVLAGHWVWLPDDGFVWAEACWSGFYNFKYLGSLRIL